MTIAFEIPGPPLTWKRAASIDTTQGRRRVTPGMEVLGLVGDPWATLALASLEGLKRLEGPDPVCTCPTCYGTGVTSCQ